MSDNKQKKMGDSPSKSKEAKELSVLNYYLLLFVALSNFCAYLFLYSRVESYLPKKKF